jgi:hypothetical protein
LQYDRTWENLAPPSKALITAWRLTDEGIKKLIKQRFNKEPGRTADEQELLTRMARCPPVILHSIRSILRLKDEQEWRTRLAHVRLFELDFRGGAILPEEFVHILREILIRRPVDQGAIRRVFFGDVSQIGVSYPFLRQSISTGDLFLPTFVHIMRNHGIDLVMTGTSSELPLANEAVNRAWSLADATLSSDLCDVFGDRHVVVRGPGQMSAVPTEARSEGELVPAVVQLIEKHAFKVDDKYLEGLVGFDTPPIHRPGVTIHVFEENRAVHGAYNQEIEAMLSAALLSREELNPSAGKTDTVINRIGIPRRVHVQPFGSTYSGAIHDSLNVLGEQAPLEETVLYTVDEFVYTADEFGKKLNSRFYDYGKPLAKELPPPAIRSRWRFESSACFWPYCSNVLLLAYRKKLRKNGGDTKRWKPRSWQEVRDETQKKFQDIKKQEASQQEALPSLPIKRLFWYDRTASETLSCALLDALVCKSPQREKLRFAEKELLEELRDAEKKLRDAEQELQDAEEKLRAVEKLSNDVKHARLKKEEAMNEMEEAMKELNAVWSKLLEQTELTTSQEENVKALCDLFHEMNATDKCHSNEANQDAKAILNAEQQEMPSKLTTSQEGNAKAILDAKALNAEQQEMPSDAGIYLCWYSQLRDLIKRKPSLAQELDVCALPGGGFTGDWFIGVVKGSVSLALGRQIIRMLCSQEEDYKRLVHGVGLPVSESFYKQDPKDPTKFYAWPHAMDIFLTDIKEIYDKAHSRAEIRHYRKFHTALSILARQLAPPDLSREPSEDEKKAREDENKTKKDAISIVGRVFAQIRALAPPKKE